MPMQILVVDDEPAMRTLLARVLRADGYEIILASSGSQAVRLARKNVPSLILLDYHLPDMDGLTVCRRIRLTAATRDIPIMILTGHPAREKPARSLDGGADDYLAKPFNLAELQARVRALLRRVKRLSRQTDVLSKGHIRIRKADRCVLWKDRRCPSLAPKEFDLLHTLVLNSSTVIEKETLAIQVWKCELKHLHERTLDVHVRRIRRKLGASAAACLRTIPTVGYQWKE
jgi:DNA-binding response OmpR family regulator